MKKSFFGRIFNYGDVYCDGKLIYFSTLGGSGSDTDIISSAYIVNPEAFKEFIEYNYFDADDDDVSGDDEGKE